MSDSQDSAAPETPPPPPAKPGLAGPIAALCLGMLLILALSVFEASHLEGRPWTQAAWVLWPEADLENAPPPDAEGVVRVWTRQVKRGPEDIHTIFESQEMRESAEALGMDMDLGSRAVLMDLPAAEFAKVLASGRLPRPGAPEALAGPLSHEEPFSLDGTAYEVVGRLRRDVSGLTSHYVLPREVKGADALFRANAEARGGWFDPEGAARLASLLPPKPEDEEGNEAAAPAAEGLEVHQGFSRALPLVSWGVLFSLVLMAVGGAHLHARIFHRAVDREDFLFQPLFREIQNRSRLYAFMHVLLYGGFFLSMAEGLSAPLWSFHLMQLISSAFTEGRLSYIGEAYDSGNILRATLATYLNNYLVQTVGLTFLVSLIIPAVGVVKTLLSFTLVGFGMAPNWTGTAAGYTYHSITMVLELQAYIVASFVVVVWVLKLFNAFFRSEEPMREMGENVRIYVGGIVLTGGMLLLAAFYEATTLILLGR